MTLKKTIFVTLFAVFALQSNAQADCSALTGPQGFGAGALTGAVIKNTGEGTLAGGIIGGVIFYGLSCLMGHKSDKEKINQFTIACIQGQQSACSGNLDGDSSYSITMVRDGNVTCYVANVVDKSGRVVTIPTCGYLRNGNFIIDNNLSHQYASRISGHVTNLNEKNQIAYVDKYDAGRAKALRDSIYSSSSYYEGTSSGRPDVRSGSTDRDNQISETSLDAYVQKGGRFHGDEYLSASQSGEYGYSTSDSKGNRQTINAYNACPVPVGVANATYAYKLGCHYFESNISQDVAERECVSYARSMGSHASCNPAKEMQPEMRITNQPAQQDISGRVKGS